MANSEELTTGQAGTVWATACAACCCCLPVIIILIFICISIPTFFIIVGAVNIDQCAAKPAIPVWMIVMGVIMFLQGILEKVHDMEANIWTSLLRTANTIALIVGSVYVFSTYSNRSNCDGLVFYSSFVYCVVSLAFFALFIIIQLGLCCVACFSKDSPITFTI